MQQNAGTTSPVLPSSPQSQFDLALTFLRHQIQEDHQPMTSPGAAHVTRSSTESLLLAALGLAVPAAGVDAASDRPVSMAADEQWPPTTVSAMTADSRRYKTELCRAFVERGQCRYGDRCQFAHGLGELRSLQRHPKYKTELCRTYHTSGFCPYGARCHFVHNGLTPPAPPPTPRDMDHQPSDNVLTASRSSNNVAGCAVPDSIQLSLLSAALEKQASPTPGNTARTMVNILALLIRLYFKNPPLKITE